MPSAYQDYEDRWRALHPGWEVRTWLEGDLEWIRNRRAFDADPNLAGKANVARYEIVLREGGVYVDCDFEPLRAIDDLVDGAELVVGEEEPGVYANGFFAATAGHPVLAYAVEQTEASHFARPPASSPERTGPRFWTRCVRRRCAELGIEPRVIRRDQIYPYPHTQDEPGARSFPAAYAVHRWAKSWVPERDRPSPRRTKLAGARRVVRGAGRAVRDLARYESIARRPAWPRHPAGTYVGNGRVMVILESGRPVLAHADDLGVTPTLLAEGVYDPGFVAFIRRTLRRGDVAVDVGANIGLFTLEMAWRVRSPGRVFSYEPNPRVAVLLADSLYANQMLGLKAEVNLRSVAVGAEAGSLTLRVPRRHSGMASANPSAEDPGEMPVDVHEVPVVTLDEDLAAVGWIDLVKIDVEGLEDQVLRGMRRLLGEGRIGIVDLELQDRRAGASWGALVAELESIVRTFAPLTYTLSSDGSSVPVGLEAAVHSEGLQHFVLDFRAQAG